MDFCRSFFHTWTLSFSLPDVTFSLLPLHVHGRIARKNASFREESAAFSSPALLLSNMVNFVDNFPLQAYVACVLHIQMWAPLVQVKLNSFLEATFALYLYLSRICREMSVCTSLHIGQCCSFIESPCSEGVNNFNLFSAGMRKLFPLCPCFLFSCWPTSLCLHFAFLMP